MRTLSVFGRAPRLLLLLFLGLALPGRASAQALQQLYARVEQSVVRVEPVGNGHTGTGFVWGSNTVVTALHVVDGSSSINIYFPVQRVRRTATVERVLPNADLVLLRVALPSGVPALQHAAAPPRVGENIYCLGFQFGAPAINSYRFTIGYGSPRLEENVSSGVVQRLRANGYPDPQLNVLKLTETSLLPGSSGAPVFNVSGQVVGIGNGGIEQGAVNVSWAIPAAHLNRLAASSARTLPRGRGTRELFAAEYDANVGPMISIGASRLLRVRTRSLPELAATADDALGLQQLSSVFMAFNPASFQYDIYQDASSGATVAVPAGSQIQSAGTFLRVNLPRTSYDHGRLEMLMRIDSTSGPAEASAASVRFERDLTGRYQNLTWQIDPQWTYPMLLTRPDGLVVRRVAANGFSIAGPEKYLFEVLAVRGNTFLGAAVVNTDNTMQTNWREGQCRQNVMAPGCSVIYDIWRLWAQSVLGLQVSSFSL